MTGAHARRNVGHKTAHAARYAAASGSAVWGKKYFRSSGSVITPAYRSKPKTAARYVSTSPRRDDDACSGIGCALGVDAKYSFD